MKIFHLTPGSGGTFYCQNCYRDAALLRALRRRGHDVMMLPMYLPIFSDTDGASTHSPIFFGGINVYLQQRFRLFQKTPRWLDRLFDAAWILRRAAKQEGSTNAHDLGPMTLSMLQGRHGRQKKEFERLMTWLAEQEKPDVIHISNALLLGLAPEIKRVLDVPIVCSLQDEEPWVEAMAEPHRRLCWEAMAANAAHVDAFIAVSAWYGGRMRERMNLTRERVHVVHLGVEIEDARSAKPHTGAPTIGFLSRLNEAQGLGTLIDAFIELKRDPALKDLRLRATGGCTPADRAFVDSIRAKLRQHGIEDAADFLDDFGMPQRAEFLRSLSVLSSPVPKGEAFGVQLIEAMAYGVPVVQPRAGAYPEIVEATGGGVLYDAERPGALVEALRSLLLDPARARTLGQHGREAVHDRFHIDRVARDTLAVYASVAKTAGS